jgi:hypothetical protein
MAAVAIVWRILCVETGNAEGIKDRSGTILALIVSHNSSYLNAFQSWRHAGEDSALVVYARPYRLRLLILCCMFVAFWKLFPLLHQYPAVLPVMAAYAFPRVLAEGRRAIIFTKSDVIYRPPFGHPWRAPIADIANLKGSRAILSVGLQLHFVGGILDV